MEGVRGRSWSCGQFEGTGGLSKRTAIEFEGQRGLGGVVRCAESMIVDEEGGEFIPETNYAVSLC